MVGPDKEPDNEKDEYDEIAFPTRGWSRVHPATTAAATPTIAPTRRKRMMGNLPSKEASC